MDVSAVMQTLEQQPFAMAISESTWMFPALESIHVLAVTIVVGSVALMDLRLLGVFSKDRALTELVRHTLPWTWCAFAVGATCGLLLFASKATTYYVNIPFRMKLVGLALAGVNMLVFHFVTARTIASWEHGKTLPQARIAGALSLLLWTLIVATGRWIGFT